MQQARPSDDRSRRGPVDPSRGQDCAELELHGASARLDGGLLMVFGPEGDPLPPKAFIAAAAAQGDVELILDGGPNVPAARIAKVIEAQSARRLVEAEDASATPWLLAMLGVGPAPAQATVEELAAEMATAGVPELMLFGEELLITSPSSEPFLLRSHREADAAAGVKIVRGDGEDVDHGRLVEALGSRAAAGDGTVRGASVEPGGAGTIVITVGGLSFHLLACGDGDDPSSVLLAPNGEAHPIEQLVDALVPVGEPSPTGLTNDERSPGAGEAGSAQPGNGADSMLPEQEKPAFPSHLTLDDDGLLDLSWLVEAAAAALGEPVVAATIRDLSNSVRPSFGTADHEGAWSLSAGELSALTLLATPEDLKPFTLDMLLEGAGRSHRVEIPVRLGSDEDPRGPAPHSTEPIAVEVAFPPPLSPRNDLDFFAVAIIDGVPPEAALTAGVRGSDGRWTLAPEDLRGLRLHLPADASLPCTLEATGINIENRDGVLATARGRVVIDRGVLSAEQDSGLSEAVRLDFRDLLEAAEVEERRVDAVALSGMPPVAGLSRGTLDRVSGCWVLRRDELEDVALTVRDPALRMLRIKATAVAVDGDNVPVVTSRTMDVTLAPGSEATPSLERASCPGFFRSLAARRA